MLKEQVLLGVGPVLFWEPSCKDHRRTIRKRLALVAEE